MNELPSISLRDAKRVVDDALNGGKFCVVIGHCRVSYEGRAASKLSEGDRVLLIKHDGTFLVHQSTGMTAINYQGPGATVTSVLNDDSPSLTVTAMRKRKEGKEQIDVCFERVHFCQAFPLTDDSKLKVLGSERELSDLLMQDLSVLEKGLVPLQQESGPRRGNLDIVARDADGKLVIIELKRRSAELAAVTQLHRYVEELSKRRGETVRGILCAPHISEKALTMAQGWGLEFAKLDYEILASGAHIKGLEKKQKSLDEFNAAHGA